MSFHVGGSFKTATSSRYIELPLYLGTGRVLLLLLLASFYQNQPWEPSMGAATLLYFSFAVVTPWNSK